MNAWLKRCVFNLDLNRESVSEPRMLFQSLGAKYEKALPPLVDFAILGTTKIGPCRRFLHTRIQTLARSGTPGAESSDALVLPLRSYATGGS